MKRSIVAVLALIMCFSLVACGENGAQPSSALETCEPVSETVESRHIQYADRLIVDGYNIQPSLDAAKMILASTFEDAGYFDYGDEAIVTDLGFAFDFADDGSITHITIMENKGAGVQNGLRVGSTVEDIKQAWGEPSVESDEVLAYFFDTYDNTVSEGIPHEYCVGFNIDNGVVTTVIITNQM